MGFKVSDLKQSKFLTQNDIAPAKLVTIISYDQQNVARENDDPEFRWILFFKELPKGLVLNSTNGQILAAITGSEDSDGWIGKKVVLYQDKMISFGGKLTGGIRIRAPKVNPTAQAMNVEPDPEIVEDDDSSIPF